jgi:predicted transposase YbfD/YdcC
MEGCCSATSVVQGGAAFHVRAAWPTSLYTVDIYRVGATDSLVASEPTLGTTFIPSQPQDDVTLAQPPCRRIARRDGRRSQRHVAIDGKTLRRSFPGDNLADTEWDGHIRAFIPVNRDNLTRSVATGLWRDTSETALFVSDVVLPAAGCAKAIRHHWHIENRSHYVRDGSFAEGASRIAACDRSLPTFCASMAFITSQMDGIASPSAASMQSSQCVS